MSANRVSLFCGTDLAERVERAESRRMGMAGEAARRRLGGAATGFVRSVAGGVATFAEPGSPVNKVAGLGFGGVPEAAELDEVEHLYAALGCPVQVELAHLADPAIGAVLSDRGYRLVSFENVLGLAVTGGYDDTPPPGITIRPGRADDADFAAWLHAVERGFAHPDGQGVPSHEDFPAEIIGNAMRDLINGGIIHYVAETPTQVVAGASYGVLDGVAQLTGAATIPEYRRRGIQSALFTTRLTAAAAAGADLAVVTTQPGSQSQHNAHRQGFDLLYTRAVLVKEH